MNWKALGPLLAVILLAALAFAFWPEVPAVPPAPPPTPTNLQPLPTENPPAPPRLMKVKPIAPLQPPVAPGPALIANRDLPPSPADLKPQLDREIDPERLRELGIPPEAIEPEDGGVLHKLDKDGIKGAIQEKLPEIKECYESWLQSEPKLAGKLKVEFQIVEIPGRERGKVQAINIAADAGMGHVAFEGCVKNVFDDLRFEAPRGGEMRVTYPFAFSNEPRGNAPSP